MAVNPLRQLSPLLITPQGTPGSPSSGEVWIDSTTNRINSYDGSVSQSYVAKSDLAIVRLGKVVCSGSQSVITFSSIPSLYTDLMIAFSGASTGSGGAVRVNLEINADTNASNYAAAQYLVGTGTSPSSGTVSSTATGSQVLTVGGTLGGANPLTTGSILLPNYSGTVLTKGFSSNYGTNKISAGAATQAVQYWGQWLSTAAISRLDLIISSGSFLDGSVATLYGIG